MTHVQFAHEVAHLCLFAYGIEYFRYGGGADCPFPEHVVVTRLCLQLDAGYPGTFLSAVVLLLHQQV